MHIVAAQERKMANLLAPQLEFVLMGAVLDKSIDYTELPRKTLSHVGQLVHQSIEKLTQEAGTWDKVGVFMVATEVFNLDRALLQEYLVNIERQATTNAKDIHVLLQERNSLIDVSNEVQRQLLAGDLDLSKIQALTARSVRKAAAITSVADALENGIPNPPGGPVIKTLPVISEAINGVSGMMLLAGLPKIGKSSLAMQIAVDLSRAMSVLVYSLEMPQAVLIHRIIASKGLEFAQKVKRLYIRTNIRTLTRDLLEIKPPALVVVDSIQKVWGTNADDRRSSADAWVRRFEELKNEEGYSVLLVSEIPRDKYSGIPSLDIFKDTGALEYAADSAFALTPADPFLKVWLVGNRHYQKSGPLSLLERVGPFWFKEQALQTSLGWEG